MTSPLFISVVLPVRNEERFIAAALARLQAQDYPPDRVEFLVCDGRSTDRTREIVREAAAADPRIRLIDNPGERSSSGRNVGFRAARGDVCLVIDGHVRIPDDQLLRHVAECFETSGADCLGRPQPLVARQGSTWAQAIVEARSSRLGHDPSSFIYGEYEGFAPAASMGAAYRRAVFERIGYVDETFDACEDLEFNTRVDRAGLRCYTSPKLAVEYFARDSPGALFKQQYRYGFGRYKYLRRHPDAFTLGQAAPPILTLTLAALPFSPLLPLWAAVPVWLGSGAYAAAVAAASFALARRRGFSRLARYWVVFPAIHLGVGVGFLSSLARGGR